MYDLDRFLEAQADTYDQALAELQQGRKGSHWMWFIFPQLQGLGHSEMSEYYGIVDLGEAKAYLAHPVLSARLRTCAETLLQLNGRSAFQIFGEIDTMKLKSSMTLFALVAEEDSIFSQVLDKYFGGRGDTLTLELLGYY